MKIIVYGICKNESKNVKQFMDSIRDADGVYICDTGSTDNTIELLQNEGAIVNKIKISPWDFSKARNKSLEFVPECDICISLDLDEVMLKGWREGIERVWDKSITEINYQYVFNWEDKECTIPRLELVGFKIHARHGYSWKYPIHEIVSSDGEAKSVYTDEVVCYHYADITKKRDYQKLLDKAIKDYPLEQRFSHQRGRELMMYNKPKQAIKELKRHLSITEAYGNEGIGQTRSMSMRYIARCLHSLGGSKDEILDWLLRACGESPYTRESWIWLAQAWFDVGDYAQAYACCMTGLRIKEKKLSIENEGCCWGDMPTQMANKAFDLMMAKREKNENKFRLRKMATKGVC